MADFYYMTIKNETGCPLTFYMTFSQLAETFFRSDLQLRNAISDTLKRGKHSQEVLLIQHFRHSSEVKEREQRCFLFVFLRRRDEFSGVTFKLSGTTIFI